MAIKEYEPGTAFPGVMGRTVGESSPAWPRPLRAKPGVAQRPLHRPRRHRLRAPRLLRLADPDAEPRSAGRGRPALQQHAHHRALLAQPVVHADRPQPPLERDGVHHRGRDRLPGLERPASRSRTASCRRCCWRTATTRMALGKWHLTPTEQCSAAGPYDRWPLGRGFERFYGFMGGDTTSTTRTSSTTTTRSSRRATPEQGYHLTEDLVDHAIEFVADAKQVAPDKPFFMYFCTGAMHAPHHVPARVGRQVQGPVRRRLGRVPAEGVRAAARARHPAGRHASCPRAIPTSRPGTAWAPTRSASTPG